MIRGEHIYLRALEPSDIDLLYTWENDTNLWVVSRGHKPISKYHLVQYLKQAHRDIQDIGQLRLMMVDNTHRQRIGLIDLFDYSAIDRRAGVGIVVHKEYRQQGVAKEGLNLIEQYATSYLNLHQLYCYIHEANTASKQLFSDAGFDLNGVRKDWIFSEGNYLDELLYQKIYE